MSFIPELFAHSGLDKIAKENAFHACLSDPGLPLVAEPVAPATTPYWFETPHPQFASHSEKDVPKKVDVVIIGSGITGTSVARGLLRGGKEAGKGGMKVVMLEARAVCSGATGRNGGHINEVGYSDYMHLAGLYGRDAAAKITKFRIGHLDELMRVAGEEGLVEESQIRVVGSVSAFFHETALDVAQKGLVEMRKDLESIVQKWATIEKDDGDGLEELKRLGLASADGCIRGRAGAVWPYKLVTGILSNLLRDFSGSFLVFAHTPATNVFRTEDGYFMVETPRGKMKTKHVVHATNGYVGHLLPSVRGAIFPLRGQMSAQKPPEWFPYQAEERSWNFEYEVGFDYLTQIPYGKALKSGNASAGNGTKEDKEDATGGDLMFGGGFAQTRNCGLEELGVTDDSELNPEATEHLKTALGRAFDPLTGREQNKKEGDFEVKSMWTGIMGFSMDSLPFVGKLPETLTKRRMFYEEGKQIEIPIVSKHIKGKKTEMKGAEWISAAYSGEGMVNAWGCGKALASMILGRESEDNVEEWFPDEMKITEERLERSSLTRMLEEAQQALHHEPAVPEDELEVSA